MANKKIPNIGECVGKLGMENGDIKFSFVKIERIYWDTNRGSLSLSQKLIELGIQHKDRPIQAIGLLMAANLLLEMKRATAQVVSAFKDATAEEISTIAEGNCQWRIKRGREDITFGLVCPRFLRRL